MTALGYFERYKQLAAIDQKKNTLIEDLLQRVTELEEAYQQEKLDHERETRFNRDIQIHEMELMDQVSRMRNIMEREPFIVVLLDGDGIIFQDGFLQQGGQGGRNAATKLQEALQNYIASNFPRIASPKIITKLYVNVKGLAELCVRGGVTTEPFLIEEFVRGFNGSFPLFELIDTGSGKHSAQEKIAETFQLYLYNCHCHQIFIGCAQDPAYGRILESALHDADLIGRVSLIEGLPFENNLELIKSTFRATKFPNLFRDTKITVWAPWKAAVASKPRSLFTPSPVQQAVPLSRTSTNTTSTNNSVSLSIASNSASNAKLGEFQIVRSKSSNSLPPPKIVERNKYGQRVDRIDFKNIPRDELNRMKKLKLCNFYFLMGECPNENCLHDHSRKLTKSELSILRAVARMTPCRYGTDCDDPDCIYGHRCPLSEPGKKDCYWGSSCRFEASAHGLDLNIVKVTKV
ncbi:hypothetical protein P170DRAFT_382370 [Aspergillus steynii IBT 23096]|uniref:C3H1-type domain-containing protein n=1 Tax=Aspergillus steynii IBT 23096 TaxID=1392250 RepID=A0A2I2GE05_9EURO|nr:uncharacterized protein P170DRAFT_382370 [Aspergillus steynii IBT 23096]PLB51129.1 hypothetical protein P170DRAFT_382370 [Aspergillus steynii IBT 23096]